MVLKSSKQGYSQNFLKFLMSPLQLGRGSGGPEELTGRMGCSSGDPANLHSHYKHRTIEVAGNC